MQEHPKLYNIMTFNDSEIYFTGKVYGESMVMLVHELKRCESKILEMEKNKNPFGEDMKTPIRLHINSTGGITHETFFAVDQMRLLKVPIHTIVSGLTASSATILSCVGTRRYITRNAYMLIHGPRMVDNMGNIKKNDNNDWYGINWNKMILHHYEQYTKMTRETIEELFDEPDRYMTPEECLAKGLVDEIL